MKNFISILLSAVFIFLSFNKTLAYTQEINSVLGDQSYTAKFAILPDQTVDEDLRIKTHLQYVEQILRQKDVSALASTMKEKRLHLLDLIHSYWTNGVLPRQLFIPYLDR